MSGDADIIGGFFAAPLGPGGLDRVGVALGVSGQPHHRRAVCAPLMVAGDACQIGKAGGNQFGGGFGFGLLGGGRGLLGFQLGNFVSGR